jgi:hypothetical protein
VCKQTTLTQLLQQCLHVFLMLHLQFCNLQAVLHSVVLATGVMTCTRAGRELVAGPKTWQTLVSTVLDTLSWLLAASFNPCAIASALHGVVDYVCVTRQFCIGSIRLIACFPHAEFTCMLHAAQCLLEAPPAQSSDGAGDPSRAAVPQVTDIFNM